VAEGATRCRHAFEAASVHANGDVVCSIIDGRGEFVLGNVHRQSLPDILNGSRARELRALVLASWGSCCPAIGKRCPLKTLPSRIDSEIPTALRFLAIEPTTACGLRCLACPVRDLRRDVSWRDAYPDGGVAFLLWDGIRRSKQRAADRLRRAVPALDAVARERRLRAWAVLLRGRIPSTRTGTLPIHVLKRVVTEAGPGIERLDLFSYGEPFLYAHLLEALRHTRLALPSAVVAVSTAGTQISREVESAIVAERLVDVLVFSIDGCDEASYGRYRVGGDFHVALSNMARLHRRAAGTPVRVIWQYVVFRWNDADDQLRLSIKMAADLGIPIWFDFAHTWGRSRRRADEVRYLAPYLRPCTALPGEPRQEGW
jgi:pyruvate-formate lyase-activating enzyme